jgi:hypothetical protein
MTDHDARETMRSRREIGFRSPAHSRCNLPSLRMSRKSTTCDGINYDAGVDFSH